MENETLKSGTLKSAPDYKGYKVYTVYKSGVLVIENGTAEECAAALGLKTVTSFYSAVCNSKKPQAEQIRNRSALHSRVTQARTSPRPHRLI